MFCLLLSAVVLTVSGLVQHQTGSGAGGIRETAGLLDPSLVSINRVFREALANGQAKKCQDRLCNKT